VQHLARLHIPHVPLRVNDLLFLQELRAAARWPLSSRVLPGLYLALLRCLLQEQVRH